MKESTKESTSTRRSMKIKPSMEITKESGLTKTLMAKRKVTLKTLKTLKTPKKRNLNCNIMARRITTPRTTTSTNGRAKAMERKKKNLNGNTKVNMERRNMTPKAMVNTDGKTRKILTKDGVSMKGSTKSTDMELNLF